MYTYKTFRKGGIHPEENKLSAGKPILDLPLPPLVTIPVLQHVGTPANTLVKKGDRVKTGQLIASGEGFISANIHASVSGTITRIEKLTDTSGYKRTAIEIETIQDEWVEDIDLSPTLIRDISLSPPEIILKIWNSGIVGLGGATFPTHVKVSLPKGKTPCCVVINGAECEPYLTSDHAIMLEKPEEILTGVAIMMKILDIERAIIGIEKNKQDAISLLSEKSNNFKGIQIQGLKVKYPQGSEKHLIKALTGREVPSAGLPIDIGVVVFNVATMFAVYEAVQKGKPLIDRIISVTGQTLKKPSNFRVRIGTHLSDLLEAAGGIPEDTAKVIAGGPMMGKAINRLDIPVTKGTSGILVLDENKSKRKQVQPCIRCSKCVSVCPMGLEPYLLMPLAERDQPEQVEENKVMDCMECGSCSYVCPANRPLLDYIRLGKIKVRNYRRKKKEA